MLIKNLPSGIENHGEERSHKENKLDIKLDSLKWFEAGKNNQLYHWHIKVLNVYSGKNT